jgi:diguanylate cyclase (GGDEF)-like protein/PAS domain S-box-containing protein
VDTPAPPTAIASDGDASRAGARAGMRVRVAMLGVLLLIAVVLLVQARQSRHAERLRGADGEIIALAASQRIFSQRLSLLALQYNRAAAPEQLEQVLAEARSQSLRLDVLLSEHLESGSGEAHRFDVVQRAWQRSREDFFAAVADLLGVAEGMESSVLQSRVRAVQALAPDYYAAALAMAEQAQVEARVHNQEALHSMKVAMALVLGLIALLALAVVEPTARMVKRQHSQAHAQTAQMRRLALVAEHTANAVALLDAEQRVEWVNPSFEALTGYVLVDVKGKQLGPLLQLREREDRAGPGFRDFMMEGLPFSGEIQALMRDGQSVWVLVDIQPLRDAAGRVMSWVVVASNIDEVVRSRQQRRALFEALPTGVLVYSRQFEVIDGNAAAMEMFGMPALQLEQPGGAACVLPTIARFGRLVRGDLSDLPHAERPAVRSLEYGESVRGDLIGFARDNGQVLWALVNSEPLRDEHGHIQGAVVCVVDVTAQKQLEQRLRDNARTDSLTALPNRLEVTDRIAAALKHHREHAGYHFAVLFMDFDRFKQVNDSLGHGVGDALLRQIAGRLQTGLRESDTFVRTSDFGQMAARIGGDEFVVLLDDIRGDLDAEVVAGRLLDLLAMPYTIDTHTINSSVSIGIVTATHADDDVESILRDADIAMYEAKRTGRGRYVMFEPSMHKRVRDDVALENDLRQALAEGQMYVVYQPLIDLVSRQMTGMEALVRWKHPLRGLVSPVEFIPIAETIGLISKIGAFVLQTACRDFAWMQDIMGERGPQSVSVNLSRAQLREASLAADVLQALRTYGVASGQLQLEVTESLAAQDLTMQGRLREIKALGVTLALDDFGTGYSSLSCLHELPIDVVKIDRSFVSLAGTSDYHRVLIEATVLMARTLGMGTLAEGIETAEQADMMRTIGCGKGQGYLFSKPLERDALVQWIRERARGA